MVGVELMVDERVDANLVVIKRETLEQHILDDDEVEDKIVDLPIEVDELVEHE